MIEGYFQKLFQRLFVSPVVSSFRILKQHVQEEDGCIRIKCRIQKAHKLEFAEYVQVHAGKIVLVTYNYHWQDDKKTMIKRWGNVPHHKEIDSFPHHLHISDTKVVSSSPISLQDLLREIEADLLS